MPNKPNQKTKNQKTRTGVVVGSSEWMKNLTVRKATIEARRGTITPTEFVDILHRNILEPEIAKKILYTILIRKSIQAKNELAKKTAEKMINKLAKKTAEKMINERYGLK
jgi:hydroxylamine reductase (hybrid-cluster protein)